MARVHYRNTTKRNTRGHQQRAAALAQASSPDRKPEPKPESSPHKTPPDRMIKPANTPPKLKRPIRKCVL